MAQNRSEFGIAGDTLHSLGLQFSKMGVALLPSGYLVVKINLAVDGLKHIAPLVWQVQRAVGISEQGASAYSSIDLRHHAVSIA